MHRFFWFVLIKPVNLSDLINPTLLPLPAISLVVSMVAEHRCTDHGAARALMHKQYAVSRNYLLRWNSRLAFFHAYS
ncbi:MAG: hypothetical protein Nkreftii_000594 [Candidatus Nitrospira kreftii]|uniref:Uncharacterized protein n=1 Tax=Candidatus Nitrospira kreftii TaxID=2652173 RepID=A0A7S8IYD5_9BACT|nr:MAG: hypothetical protein Nkreftii_000594 [Candidatus Nitrospira kreftii]